MGQIATLVDLLVARLLKLRNRHFLALDVLTLLVTPAAALMLRAERFASVQAYWNSLVVLTLVSLFVKILVFRVGGLYGRYWKYASIDELAKITLAVAGAVVVQVGVFLLVLRPLGGVDLTFPRSVPLIDGLLPLLVVGGTS